jgi:hypothetical protein
MMSDSHGAPCDAYCAVQYVAVQLMKLLFGRFLPKLGGACAAFLLALIGASTALLSYRA